MLLPLLLTLADQVYLATYFLGNGEAGAYLAVSDDGYKFRPIVEPNVPILKPTVGPDKLMRDPCLLHGQDGRWHMVWTTGWWDKGIGISHSADLVHWDNQQTVPVMASFPDALNAWAPEIAYDDNAGRYQIFWSSTLKGQYTETSRSDGDLAPDKTPLNHRFYMTSTKDFRGYAPTKLLWDPGFNCIDATLARPDNQWLLFGKDETRAPEAHKWLFVGAARHANGPFTMKQDHLTGNFWAEGPTAVSLGSKHVRVYFDRYTEGKWGAIESRDLQNWTDISDKIEMVDGARHGTVLLVEKRVVDNVRKALGQ